MIWVLEFHMPGATMYHVPQLWKPYTLQSPSSATREAAAMKAQEQELEEPLLTAATLCAATRAGIARNNLILKKKEQKLFKEMTETRIKTVNTRARIILKFEKVKKDKTKNPQREMLYEKRANGSSSQ